MSIRKALWLLAVASLACGESQDSVSPTIDGGVSIDAQGLQPDGGESPHPNEDVAQAIMALPIETEVSVSGLEGPVYVLRTEGGIPHIFAENTTDLMRVHGYILAQDRFWMMDLGRRLASGRLSHLFGGSLLGTDMTSRSKGLKALGERIWSSLSESSRTDVTAFAEGINTYIEHVESGEQSAPSEYQIAYGLLGASGPAELMMPFTGQDIAYFTAVVAEESACARDEVRRTLSVTDLLSRASDESDGEFWQKLYTDLYQRIEPIVFARTSHPGQRMFPIHQPPPLQAQVAAPAYVNKSQLLSLTERLHDARRFGGQIIGSNAWGADGTKTTTGGPIIAGDGHLALTAPAYFHQAGLDLSVFGDSNWHVRGNFLAGIPALGVGTNGSVAWSFTCYYSDTIDYFAEEIILGADGLPESTMFQGELQTVTTENETYDVRAVAALGSEGGQIEAPQFILFDGRRLLSIEGRIAEEGESGIYFGGDRMIFEDVDGDGVVSGISFDATFLDAEDLLGAYFELAGARTMDEFLESQRKLMVTGSHFVVADQEGSLGAVGYHASPCRDGLPRTADGRHFLAGADPQTLLDGTQYGGFRIELSEDGYALSGMPETESCTVDYDRFPGLINPEVGFLVSANNDPSGLSFDGSIANDDTYVGGPWDIGFRADRIDARLGALSAERAVDVESMASIQADVHSSAGFRWVPHILVAIEKAQGLSMGEETPENDSDERLIALFGEHQDRLQEVHVRFSEWLERDTQAASGVETFYHQPSDQDRRDAVATTIFNFWLSVFQHRLTDGLSLVPAHRVTDDNTMGRFIHLLLAGRGPGNPSALATYDEAIGESVLFDDRQTDEIETSNELIVHALVEALLHAASTPVDEGLGGFGTSEMTEWLWGLRHMVAIDSLIAPFLGDDPALATFADLFSISPRQLPLTEAQLEAEDPRRGLPGFPRPGDNYSVDAAEHGFDLNDFQYRSGPVMRMVIGLDPDGRVRGQNIIPGGQSGLKDSPHAVDQLAEWLGNRAYPLRYHVEDVLEYAAAKEVYAPSP